MVIVVIQKQTHGMKTQQANATPLWTFMATVVNGKTCFKDLCRFDYAPLLNLVQALHM